MGLINEQSMAADAKAVKVLKNGATGWYRKSINRYEQALEVFWKNPEATPQQVSDKLGSSAADLFAYIGALRTFILTVNPNAQLTPPNSLGTWTVNPDGTVTINSVNQ